ncbi:hypothetical protein Goklo_005646 [Gossypium klotzschianum]|uniref:Uncharacterized protein n=1 Tax=Gossypium klotzschianum TaxID=34286 RepID=A0A7J8VEW2_9ROSI|nr:hypothetical protein [Gossypium klotzschianum]
MASKLKNMNKAILFIAMFGLVLGILARSCIEGLLKHVEEKNGSYFGRQFDAYSLDTYQLYFRHLRSCRCLFG